MAVGYLATRITDGWKVAWRDYHPTAVATAVGFGIAVGGMPKTNLMAIALMAFACFIRMNYGVAILVAAGLSCVPGWSDAMTEPIGRAAFEARHLQSLWRKMESWPFLPWTDWNNTVVMGSQILAMAMFLPVYVSCYVARWRTSHRIARPNEASGSSTMASQPNAVFIDADEEAIVQEMLLDMNSLLAPEDPADEQAPEPHLEGRSEKTSASLRIDRSSKTRLNKPNVAETRRPAMAIEAVASSKPEEAVLQETVIEVVRLRPNQPMEQPPAVLKAPLTTRHDRDPESSTMTTTKALTIKTKPSENTKPENVETLASIEAANDNLTAKLASIENHFEERPREEALRYLLWHLSSTKQQMPYLPERVS
jgi:uncharacterized protein (TIGR03546 family)